MKCSTFAFPILLAACGPELGPVVPQTDIERKMIGLLEKFDRWDDNGDGSLDLRELTAGMNTVETTRKPDAVLAFYDTNRDGKISLKEAQQGYSRADQLPPPR